MTRSELRRLKYALVRNKFQNAEIANAARDYSWERLFYDYGIKRPKTAQVPDLRYISPERQAYYDRKLRKFNKATAAGLDPETADVLTQYSFKSIDENILYREELTKGHGSRGNKKQSRIDMWSKWSRSNQRHMPPELRRLAAKFNRAPDGLGVRFDDNSRYGYAVAYYMFVEGRSYDEIHATILKPERFDPDAYKDLRKARAPK